MATKKPEIFNDPDTVYQEPSSWIRWGKIGDWLYGTYIDKIEYEKNNEMQTDYLILVKQGEYHDKSGEAIELSDGDEIRIGSKRGIDGFMSRRELGDNCAFEYVEDIPTKNPAYSDFRRVECRHKDGDVNKEWMKKQDLA